MTRTDTVFTDLASGRVGGFDLDQYVIEDFDTSPERFDYMVNSQDFGYNHADCIGEVGFKDGELYLCREIYEFEKDTGELIELADKRGFNKSLTMWCDSAEPDRIKMWRKVDTRQEVLKRSLTVYGLKSTILNYINPYPPKLHKYDQRDPAMEVEKNEKTNEYLDEPVNFFDDAMAMPKVLD